MASPSQELQSPSTIIDLEAEEDEDENVIVPEPYASVSNILDANPPSAYLGKRTELQDELTQASLKAMTLAFEQTLHHESTSLPYINEMLSSLNPSHAPQTRSSKNKAKKEQPKLQLSETPLTTLITSGMDAEQIWEQLEMRSKGLCEMLDKILDTSPPIEDDEDGGEDDDDEDEGSSIDWDGEMDEDESEEEEDEEDVDAMDIDPQTTEERLDDLRDPSPELSLDLDAPPSPPRKSKKKKSNNHGLDDDFFSLDAFNAEAEEAEARSVSKGRLADDSDESEEEEDLDLFAPVDDIEAEDDAGEAYYKDFFVATASPSKKPKAPTKSSAVRFHDQVRVREIERKGKGRPLSTMSLLSAAMDEDDEDGSDDDEDEDDEDDGEDGFGEDMSMDMEVDLQGGEDDEESSEGESDEGEDNAQHTMDRFQDDLFADEDGQNDEEEELTAHEKRMQELTAQIASLEAENVGSKEWVLTGEASTRSRPQNSLLEQDLDFDRNSKSTAPVITEEVVASLEEKIKKRILDSDFDDVVRIRAPAERDYLPSRLVELNDKKSGKSLAELYEDDYVHGAGKDGEDRDGKLKKEHDELEKVWDDICAKLDALANAHWVPKAPKTTISSISNIATASLESALPTSLSTSTLLAPQEVFTPAASANKSRSEMTPAEKQALHNKQRKIRKKQNEAIEKLKDGRGKSRLSIKQQKQEALKSVVKSGKGVTVVGKQPDMGKKKGKPRQA